MTSAVPDPDRWARADALFAAALDLPAPERAAFVAREAGTDEALRARVERLLSAVSAPSPLDERSQGAVRDALLREAAVGWDVEPAATPEPWPEIPRFRLERELGQGGMGRVYLATRTDGEFTQQVAIKVLRRGVASDDVLRRFRRERQLLASFTHPGIARLLDGGLTRDGRPFLAMEFVAGDTLVQWAQATRADVDARLARFDAVCAAVEYAHQRLVVHRDIKPSNILVDADGTPRLLDFGIAKLLDADGLDSAQTRTGLIYATPRYASPEQLADGPVTTATDVYQLGLLLYELLADVHPFEPGDGIPSTRRRGRDDITGVQLPVHAVPGTERRHDLDAIIRKALRPEVELRFASVAALRADVQRARRGEPVEARAGARWYRVRRTLRRRRVPIAMAALALTAGLVYVGTVRNYAQRLEVERNRAQAQAARADSERVRAGEALLVAQRERREADSARRLADAAQAATEAERQRTVAQRDAAQRARAAAERDNARARAVTTFLVDLFRAPGDRATVRADTITARTLLERGTMRVRTELADQPAVLAPLLGALGTASQRLGLPYDSLFAEERAALMRAVGAVHPDVAQLLQRQADTHAEERDFVRAAAGHGEAVGLLRRLGAADSTLARALLRQANALMFAEQVEAASAALREAQYLRPDVGDGDEQADLQNRLASIARRQGDLATADSLLRRALTIALTDSVRAVTLNNLGSLLRARERFAESESFSRQALSLARRVYPPTDRSRNVAANNLAGLLAQVGRYPEAIALLEEEVATHRASFPADHWRLGQTVNSLAVALRQAGRPAEAADRFAEAAGIFARGLGPTHEWTQRAERDRDGARAATARAAAAGSPAADSAGTDSRP